MPVRLRRILLIILASVFGLTLLVFLVGAFALRGSRPRLSGHLVMAGLAQQVTVTRDSLGVPDIQAESRLDAARTLGYLHGQDRFFQMDLQRRNAAGELSALLGSALLDVDRDTRRHQFRVRAERVVEATSGPDRALLEAYTAGVNAGLYDLKSRPFEYLVLRQKPEPWRPADTILTLHAMFLDLSYWTSLTEEAWSTVRDNLSPEMAEFLLPRGNRWEAPLQTDPVSGVSVPDSSVIDVRDWIFDDQTYEQYRALRHDSAGSNNWAVAGSLTHHGGAILANDMHLGHGLPNIWYRARMSWPEGDGTRSVVGVTLPGTPALVSGSNGQVAWGYTNSYGDWADLVILETDPQDPTLYRTADGWQHTDRQPEIITVAGSSPDTIWVEQTLWGPVWTTDSRGRRLALRWTAHDTEAVNLNLLRLESASDVEAVVALAGTVGIPQQNLVCADDQGHIAWTIIGPIPRRVGWDGRMSVSWADGSCRWDGYLDPALQPRIVDPEEGRLWTANNRITAGQDLEVIGDGGYGLGARARQIRDDLRGLDRPGEGDLLAVQLDDRAVLMGQWRELFLEVLQRSNPAEGSARSQFLAVVRDDWSGHADVESVAYRLVRNATFNCQDRVYKLLLRVCRQAAPDIRARELPYRLAVTWEVLAARPDHLLPPWSDDWDEFILQAVDWVVEGATSEGKDLAHFTWGAQNGVRVEHPFTNFAPWLSRWLSAPTRALPGDSFMPRVQHRGSGASERLVVSPGREELGILHMPGGQSGHPLSPFFLAGHEAWAQGNPTPLLPGRVKHRLVLQPESR
jgi:penicillin G amidase